MFTGIIEELGTIKSVQKSGSAMVLSVTAQLIVSDVQRGDSISVNGVCLTVTSYNPLGFTVDVVPETMRQTNLGELKPGDRVNLERAMAASGRYGGHFVSGHIDTTALITAVTQEGNAWVFRFQPADPDGMQYLVPRGSIAVDGISLTLNEVTDTTFTVSIIPHTLDATVLGFKKAGARINLEFDQLAKQVARQIEWHLGTPTAKSGITKNLLEKHGFASS